jgi:hypothetical protein
VDFPPFFLRPARVASGGRPPPAHHCQILTRRALREGFNMNKLQLLLRSRKFWASVIGLIIIIVNAFHPDLPLDSEQITEIVYVIISYILGTAIEDGLSAHNKENKNVKV